MAEKPLLFISHITEEKDLAIEFKTLVEDSFLGMLEVFVSSDENSISMGQKWLENITFSLKNCAVEVILCSPQSVQRPWINFEAGAGWVRDIPVIPLCHSGMKPSDLPTPLNSLQGTIATDKDGLKQIFSVLAKSLDSKSPPIDFSGFIGQVEVFEGGYISSDIKQVVTTSKIQLSNEASILLKEVSLDGNGIVLHLSVIGGTIIQTNGKNLVGSDNAREIAKWKSALQELTNKKLLQVRNKNGVGNDSYEITSLGYEIADSLKIEDI